MNQFIAEVVYEEVECGSSWYTASLQAENLPANHLQRIAAAQSLAKRYATLYGRPWPIDEADLLDGGEAYEMACYKTPWAEVAEKLSYTSGSEAEEHAQAFARVNSRSWPPKISKGAVAYNLRAEEQCAWKEIISRLGISEAYAIRSARQHAVERGLPWPVAINSNPTGERAYNERRQTLDTWEVIGRRLGFSRGHVQKYARQYAHDHNLPWPVQKELPADLGRKLYEARRKSYRPWGQLAKTLGFDIGGCGAFNHAKAYAEASGLEWPIPAPLTDTGERAYKIRAERHLTWREIGESLGVCADYACRAARLHAKAMGAAWPIAEPTTTPPKPVRVSGRKAYEMRSNEHLEWGEVAQRLGICLEWATRRAREYAQEQGLPWPIVLPGGPNQRAHQLRLSGMSWDQIAKHEGCCHSVAQDRARRWAEANHLEWPIPVSPVRAPAKRAKEAYGLGYLEKVAWDQVAERLGYASAASARNSAREYAQKLGLVAQKRRSHSRDPDRKEAAYKMRMDRPDLSWRIISNKLGYKAARSALTAARNHAQEKNLPWPPSPV